MIMHNRGFSLIELLVVIAIFGLIIGATSDMFVNVLHNATQQGKISESNTEGIIGLEMLRRDVESAGYGLPWVIPDGVSYTEANSGIASTFNDSPSNPPRAIVSGPGVMNGADYLVIKAVNVARSDDTQQKWCYLLPDGTRPDWTSVPDENLGNSNRVIVLSPGSANSDKQMLITSATGSIYTQFSGVGAFASGSETRIVYGVDSSHDLHFPFNRADYYVSKSGNLGNPALPARCAPGTGVLVKAILGQSGDFANSPTTTLPLLDCVADMKIKYVGDDNGSSWGPSAVLDPLTAQQIRDQLKEIRVSILAHEGQKDRTYTHPTSIIDDSMGTSFVDLTTIPIPDWQNYRWKVYRIVVKFKSK